MRPGKSATSLLTVLTVDISGRRYLSSDTVECIIDMMK